jgi:hypothetical protein
MGSKEKKLNAKAVAASRSAVAIARGRDPQSNAVFAAIHASKAFTVEAAYRAFAGLKRRSKQERTFRVEKFR